MEANNRIIVALDVDRLDEVERLADLLYPYVGYFKIGLQLLTAVGAPKIIETLSVEELGGAKKIFFDGKFADIPTTVGKAAKEVALLGVGMFNIHALSGIKAMRAAVQNKGDSLVLAVTILTSIDETECQMMFGMSTQAKVLQLARLAKLAGVDGLICSPNELEILNQPELNGLLKITPGIRPTATPLDDQQRVSTPKEAILAGADYLVIGRPITQPQRGTSVEVAKRIRAEIERGLTSREEANK